MQRGGACRPGSPVYQRPQWEGAGYVTAPIGSFQGGHKGQGLFVR